MAAITQDEAVKEARGGSLPPQYLRYVAQAVVFGLVLIGILSYLFLWRTEPEQASFVLGEAAPVDVLAPERITYVSELATEAERERAVAAVKEIYTAPDPQITEQQLAHAHDVFAYITTVRNDPYLSTAQRLSAIQQIPDLNVAQAVLSTILDFDDNTWQNTITITLRVMEQVLQEGIRENQLLEVRSRLTAALASEILPAEQEKVVVGLARALVAANSRYDAAATEAAKSKAREDVKFVQRTIEKGQAILRAGDIVTPLDLEELTALGLSQRQRDWQEVVGVILIAALIVLLPALFINQVRPGYWVYWRRVLLICLLIGATVTLAKLTIPGHTLIPYLFPIAAVSMLLALLLADITIAVVLTATLSVALGIISGNSLEFATFAFVSGVVGALSISRRERTTAFVRAGLFVSLANLAVSMAFRLYNGTYDLMALSQLTAAAFANGILSASITFAVFSWVGRLFGITTSIQLLELARPTQPLLKQLALKAPGTYHHTLIVANMAEQAAEAIGADSLLARIGAYYHDIGKMLRPYFFIENMTERENIHDRLDPKTSAQIIISHVRDGLELARRHRLPVEVQHIVAQHHGTTLVSFFYQQARQRVEGQEVDEAEFRYPGPKPQTREAAIVMLADVEAAVRSAHPASLEETERLVRQFINVRLVSGELDECDLTLRDLDTIREAFVSVLKGVFHPRIQYPSEPREQGRVVGPLAPPTAREPVADMAKE